MSSNNNGNSIINTLVFIAPLIAAVGGLLVGLCGQTGCLLGKVSEEPPGNVNQKTTNSSPEDSVSVSPETTNSSPEDSVNDGKEGNNLATDGKDGNEPCSIVEFNGSDAKLRYTDIQGNASSRTISQSNSVRGWSYKGRLASYVIFNGSESVVIVQEFNPDTGQFGRKLETINISNSDSIRGWDWDESKGIASFLFTNSSGTFVAVQEFSLQGFGSRIETVKLSNSALSKLGSSWTWNDTLAEYTLNSRTKVQYFDGDSFGSVLPNESRYVGNNIVGRSCY